MSENLRVREIKVLLHDAERLSEDFPEACLTTLRKLWEASILELGGRYVWPDAYIWNIVKFVLQ